MTVIPMPNMPDPEPNGIPIVGPLLESLLDLFGDMTVGDALQQLADMPLKDLLKELLP